MDFAILGMKGEICCRGKINLNPGEVLEKSLTFVTEKGYEP